VKEEHLRWYLIVEWDRVVVMQHIRKERGNRKSPIIHEGERVSAMALSELELEWGRKERRERVRSTRRRANDDVQKKKKGGGPVREQGRGVRADTVAEKKEGTR
jgi:hypothetical protein